MKKIDFMSPEALLQAEIFGNNQEIVHFSDVTDVSNENTIIVNTVANSIIYAYYNKINNIGLFWVQFTPLSNNCSISIDDSLSFFADITSSNNTAYIDNNTIKFSEVSTDTNIIVSGRFKLNNQVPIGR